MTTLVYYVDMNSRTGVQRLLPPAQIASRSEMNTACRRRVRESHPTEAARAVFWLCHIHHRPNGTP